MDLENKKRQYQRILIEEYRSMHPEETMNCTDEEVALMNPISNDDIYFLIVNELKEINKSILECIEDINYCKKVLGDSSTHHQIKTELKKDIVDDERELSVLRTEYENLKDQLFHLGDLDESKSRN